MSGLGVMFDDLMVNIRWFFNVHDKNKKGYLTKAEVLTLSKLFFFSFLPSLSHLPPPECTYAVVTESTRWPAQFIAT
jgi:hypothetical protein